MTPSQSRSPTAFAVNVLPSDSYEYWNRLGSSIWKSSVFQTGSSQAAGGAWQWLFGPPQHGVCGVSGAMPLGNAPVSTNTTLALLPILFICSAASVFLLRFM